MIRGRLCKGTIQSCKIRVEVNGVIYLPHCRYVNVLISGNLWNWLLKLQEVSGWKFGRVRSLARGRFQNQRTRPDIYSSPWYSLSKPFISEISSVLSDTSAPANHWHHTKQTARQIPGITISQQTIAVRNNKLPPAGAWDIKRYMREYTFVIRDV